VRLLFQNPTLDSGKPLFDLRSPFDLVLDLDDSNKWLGQEVDRQTVIERLYIALCLDKRKLIDFLKEPCYPVVPVEPKPKKEKKIPKDRKKFSREDATKLFESGSSYAEIANIYGVSRVAVWKALS
jgi:hypothetical protein